MVLGFEYIRYLMKVGHIVTDSKDIWVELHNKHWKHTITVIVIWMVVLLLMYIDRNSE